MTFPNVFGQLNETIGRIADNQAYAAAQAAGGSMQIQPDKVDEIANFFDDEAKKMADREGDLYQMANVPAPGLDPVSTGAATTFGVVAQGDPQAYADNYAELGKVFREAAIALRDSANLVRTNDDTSAHGLST